MKNILKYLKRTKGYMLVYQLDELCLTRVVLDISIMIFQTDRDLRKSTSDYISFIRGNRYMEECETEIHHGLHHGI